MKAYSDKHNVFDAVDCLVEHGVVAFSGTEDSDKIYVERVMKCLKVYKNILPIKSYINTNNTLPHGYLYFIYDSNKFVTTGDKQLIKILNDIR